MTLSSSESVRVQWACRAHAPQPVCSTVVPHLDDSLPVFPPVACRSPPLSFAARDAAPGKGLGWSVKRFSMPLNGGANRGETLWKAARGWPAAHHGTGTSRGGRCGVVCICPASASGPLRVRVVRRRGPLKPSVARGPGTGPGHGPRFKSGTGTGRAGHWAGNLNLKSGIGPGRPPAGRHGPRGTT